MILHSLYKESCKTKYLNIFLHIRDPIVSADKGNEDKTIKKQKGKMQVQTGRYS